MKNFLKPIRSDPEPDQKVSALAPARPEKHGSNSSGSATQDKSPTSFFSIYNNPHNI